MSIDISQLPKEIQDRLYLKEEFDRTFTNALSEDYTDILFETLEKRKKKDVMHSFIASCYGGQGSGKCIEENTLIYYFRKGVGWKIDKIKLIKKNDYVISQGYNNLIQFSKIKNIWKSKKEGYIIKTKRSDDCIFSFDHKHIIKRDNFIIEKKTKELKLTDSLLNYRNSTNKDKIDTNTKAYSQGYITGAYLADGCITNTSVKHKNYVLISKSKGPVSEMIKYHWKNTFNEELTYFESKNKKADRLVSYNPFAVEILSSFGQKKNKQFIPQRYNLSFLKGLLDGYANGDSCINQSKSKTEFGFLSKSKKLILALQTTIGGFGFCASYFERELKSTIYKGNIYYGLKFGRKEGERLFSFINLIGKKKSLLNSIKKIPLKNTNSDNINIFNNLFENPIISIKKTDKVHRMVDIETENGNFFLANNVLTHNSYSSLTLASILDDNFKIDQIFFDIEILVNERRKLKTNTCILVDEMQRGFGTDSMRVNIMINSMKEQLRKRSIHMFYCSPTLKDEYRTSLYIMETMFIDEENKLNYLAYKTNELLTLGYVTIPHPVNFLGKKFIKEYEKIKDEHLDTVLTGPKDLIEERARQIMANKFFKKAEKIYLNARGYIPYKTLVQVIEKLYPEFKGSIIVYELSDRIKTNKEISGEWSLIPGRKKQ